jgi:hypothetical protein
MPLSANGGYQLYSAGAILTAAQVNTTLMQQSIITFATETARDAALTGATAPVQGMQCYITTPAETKNGYGTGRGTQGPIRQTYNGTKWITTSPITSYGNVVAGASFATVTTTTLAALGAVTAQGVPQIISMETGTKVLVTLSSVTQSQGNSNEANYTVAVNGTVYSTNAGEIARSSVSSSGELHMTTFQRPVTVTAGINTFTFFAAGASPSPNIRFASNAITVQALL